MTWAESGVSPETRFWARVEKTPHCWNWTGRPSGGYGRIRVNGVRMQAHTYSYLLHGGVIPPGKILDHLCRNQLCVRPGHLEPVTHRINCLRGISPPAIQAKQVRCKRDHPLSGDNLLVRKNGKRECRTCIREMRAAWTQRNLGRVNRQKRESYHRNKALNQTKAGG